MASISWISAFLIFFTSAASIAQEDQSLPADIPLSAPPLEERFQDYEFDRLLRIKSEFPVYSFYLGAPDVNGVAYVPNFSPRLGAQYAFKDLGVSFSLALPLPPEEVHRRGQTDQLNFLISKYWRDNGVDVFFQNYRGFYIASPWTELRTQKPEKYPQLPDAEIIHYGFNFYQVLEPENYSLKAAYSQMEKQLHSGGSALWTIFFDHLDLKRGEKFIPGSESNDTNHFPKIKGVRLNTGGGGIGYGYTYITGPYQLSAQILAGAGLQAQKIEEEGDSPTENLHFALKGNLNASLGYRFDNYSIGGKFLLDTLVSNVKNTQIYSSLVNGSVFFGSRF